MLTLKIMELSRNIKIYFKKRKKKKGPLKVVALTANGISKSAGIPDFGGLWHEIPVREILTSSFAEENQQSYEEYCQQTKDCCEKEPTIAHKVLAKAGVSIITQNIDRLHQKAGSKEVIEFHGNLWDGLVLFDEEINDWWKAIFELRAATHLLVIGCDLNIMPAGMLPEYALEQGVEVINIETNIDQEVPAWLKKMGLIN